MVKQSRKRGNKNNSSVRNKKEEKLEKPSSQSIIPTKFNSICAVIIAVGILSIYMFIQDSKDTTDVQGTVTQEREKKQENIPKSFYNQQKGFRPRILNELNIKSITLDKAVVTVKPLTHKNKRSSVKAYVLENFFTSYECDSLVAVHDRHIYELTSKHVPLICFDSLKTFRQNLKEIGLGKMRVNNNDFIEGTVCINESLSLMLKNKMKWSYSTAFYPGESKFSLSVAERIKKATGLALENGGKFQITSYPLNVGYKNHTDCIEGIEEKRDRFATILVYLKDVEEGGETMFPQLGIKVKPKKGLALVWNSMTSDGICDPTSIHNAAKVTNGHKYIFQRWYYYQNFASLGKRQPEPDIPARKNQQPKVSCDEYEYGSCRWYDEWNYDHIIEYRNAKYKLV